MKHIMGLKHVYRFSRYLKKCLIEEELLSMCQFEVKSKSYIFTPVCYCSLLVLIFIPRGICAQFPLDLFCFFPSPHKNNSSSSLDNAF